MNDRSEFVELQVKHLLALANEHGTKCPSLARYYLDRLQRVVVAKKVTLDSKQQEQACPFCSSLLPQEQRSDACGCAKRRQALDLKLQRKNRPLSAKAKKHSLKAQVSHIAASDKLLLGSGLKGSSFFQVPETKRPLESTQATTPSPAPKRFSFASASR